MKTYCLVLVCAAVVALLVQCEDAEEDDAIFDGVLTMDIFNFLIDTVSPMAQMILTEMWSTEVVFLLH